MDFDAVAAGMCRRRRLVKCGIYDAIWHAGENVHVTYTKAPLPRTSMQPGNAWKFLAGFKYVYSSPSAEQSVESSDIFSSTGAVEVVTCESVLVETTHKVA